MEAAPARAARERSTLLRARLRLAGLPVDLALEGCSEAFAALELHRDHAPQTHARPAFALRLRAFSGLPPKLDHVAFEQRGEALFCDGDGLRGEVAATWANLDVFGGEPALFAAMRLCCALWLAPRGGLLLHGACVEPAPGGRALALLGQSGAGKSTVSRRLALSGARVISDEVTAVRVPEAAAGAPHEGALEEPARVHGHPFPRRLGDGLAPPGGLPVAALGFLSHAQAGAASEARPITPAAAARALLARVFLPVRSPALVAAALSACERLAAATPAFAISLSNDEHAARCILGLPGGAA
jgi:hypothetical protein